jgi:hypothetical protein
MGLSILRVAIIYDDKELSLYKITEVCVLTPQIFSFALETCESRVHMDKIRYRPLVSRTYGSVIHRWKDPLYIRKKRSVYGLKSGLGLSTDKMEHEMRKAGVTFVRRCEVGDVRAGECHVKLQKYPYEYRG